MIGNKTLPWMALGALVICSGCLSRDINTIYGRRRGTARTSLNGTSVLSDMFRRAGYKVTTWTRLSPRLERSQVIVWTPNSFELPNQQEIDYLEEWLANGPGRTLVYVGRDYDAAIEYWRSVSRRSGGKSFWESRRHLARARADHALMRSYTGKALDCAWFSIESGTGFDRVTPSEGTWAKEIDPEKTNLVVAGKLNFSKLNLPQDQGVERNTLLGSPEGPLIERVTRNAWAPQSQLVVVINGSALLNFPLIHHEHRKIAGQLINLCGTPGHVTFLESGPGGLPISRSDPHAHTGFEAFTVWPISSILLHLTIAGILYCVMVFPIFGKPRDIVEDPPSDFGKHVRAMGALLAHVNDRNAALVQVRQYRELMGDPPAPDLPAPGGNPFQTPAVKHPV